LIYKKQGEDFENEELIFDKSIIVKK